MYILQNGYSLLVVVIIVVVDSICNEILFDQIAFSQC